MKQAAVYTVGFGFGADTNLLEGLAFDNGGEYTFIAPGSNAIEELSTFL